MSSARRIRVLHFIDGLAGGGCERWLWDLVRLSAPEQFEHRVVTMQPDPGNYVYAERLRARGAYNQPAGSRFLNFLWRNIRSLAARERLVLLRKALTLTWRLAGYELAAREAMRVVLKFRPDVVHTHGYYGLPAGLITKALFRKPLVHTVPALFSQMKDARYGWTPKLYVRAKNSVDYFFTGASVNELLSLGIPETKIGFIHGGTDLDAISAVKNERHQYHTNIRRSLGLPDDVWIALSVGRLHPSKGHLYALESLPKLLDQFANLHWIVLGEGLQRQKLETRAADLGVAQNVHFLGFRPDPLPYLAAADIYLRTPIFEADNLSSYQAVAMGLPVVGFDTGNENELIKKADNGILVRNRDSDALAMAISYILNSPDHGRAMGERGAEFSQKHLDLRQMIEPLTTAYVALAK